MISILGRVLKTLSYQVDKEIKESLYANDIFLSHRWSFFEKSIVHWSIHYKKYTVLSLILSFFVVWNLVVWQPWVNSYVVQNFPEWKKLLEWQGTFLEGQLTIVGVVYPLVVGLISVLFQNKSAKRVILPIYQMYSGFMFAGLSGLTLSGFILTGYFLRATIGDHIYVAICLTSAMWLCSNLLLTAWFFIKTFRMLDEKSRESIVFRFSINEACEIDVRRSIKQLLLENAIDNKLIVNPDEETMDVMAFEFSSDQYQKVTRTTHGENAIRDIKFRLINAAIRLQVSILKYKKINGCKLIIKPQPRNRTDSIMIVAKYDGFDMNPFVKILIKISFSFEKKGNQKNVGLSAIVTSFVGPAYDAIRDSDAREFLNAVDNLVLWHVEVAQSLSFKNDDGNLENWLLLPMEAWWKKSYLDELLGEYYRLARAAVECIPVNSNFYRDMLSLHKRIFASRDTLIENEMRSLIQGGYYMWFLLVEWRSYNSESNDLRIANKYEDILYDFVGAWESWQVYINLRSKRLGDLDKSNTAFITHLEFTASTAISALRFNNFEAAGWGVDMLINWHENFSDSEYLSEEYIWRSVLINHSLLTTKTEDPIWQTILRGATFDNNTAFKNTAFKFALKNAQLDLRVITACYILLKPGESQRDLLAKLVRSLLSGTRVHPTGAINSGHTNINNAGELLGTYIRHRDYCHHGDGAYGRWLSSILASFGRIYEERMISGRIYSGWGASGPENMNRAYVDIGISMSDRKWSLPNNWEEAILSDAFREMDRESIISDLKCWIQIATNENTYILVDSERQDEFKANFIESVEGVIQKIVNAQSQAVADAKIDRERLRKFGVASSTIFRAASNREFPLSLFKNLDLDANLNDDFAFPVNIVNYPKNRVSEGIETNRSVNEDETLVRGISQSVKNNLLRKLLLRSTSVSHDYSDIDNILSDLPELSNSVINPVLLVGNQAVSEVLYRAPYEKNLADMHLITRQDGFGRDYICHIGQCEVYAIRFSDVDYCLLTSKELFDTVGFRQVAADQYVDVDFELNKGSETIGKLKLKYWMKIELTDAIPCIKIELITQGSDLT
jgi:hypothetical protein